MSVLALDRHASLDELIGECKLARSSARAAIARSVDLVARLTVTQRNVTHTRLTSRSRTHYARIDGVVDGVPVAAIVRRDGTVSGDARLLQQVDLVVNLGDSFGDGRLPASVGSDPLASALTVARACDSVVAVVMHAASSRPDVPQVLAVGSLPQSAPEAGGSALPEVAPRRRSGGSQCSLDYETLLRATVALSDGVQVVSLSGELDIAYREELEAALASAAKSGTDVVVDVARLAFIDASGLSALVAARKRADSSGHRLVVRGAHGIVRRVFGICQLDHLLDG